MSTKIIFGPMEIKKENGSFYSYILVENGPRLMEKNKSYMAIFKKIIDEFPTLENVTFYDKSYTTYKIKTKGRRIPVIDGIKKLLLEKR